MNRTLSISLTLALSLAVAAEPALASGSKPPPSGPLDQTFISILVRQDEKPRQLVPGTVIRLSFSQGRVVANAGCNTMSGQVTVTEQTLVITSLAITEMACQPARQAQDTWLAEFLTADPYWSLDGGTLTLATGESEIILGQRLPAIPDQPLLNRHWIVDSVLGDRVVRPVPADIHVSLLFQPAADGSVNVSGILICNALFGTATVRGDTITTEGIGTTKRGCRPDDPMVHTGVLTALNGTSSFWIDDDQLTIAKPTGPGLIMHPAF